MHFARGDCNANDEMHWRRRASELWARAQLRACVKSMERTALTGLYREKQIYALDNKLLIDVFGQYFNEEELISIILG